MLIVKDFSRFGGDYLEVGNYMEFVFLIMGMRFISVNDGYDSKQQSGMIRERMWHSGILYTRCIAGLCPARSN